MQVAALETELFAAEEEGARLKARLEAGRARASAVRSLLDEREADVYEREEAVRAKKDAPARSAGTLRSQTHPEPQSAALQ